MISDVNTSLYAVFGDPVDHSLSPAMHNSAFSFAGFNGVYLAFQIKDIQKAVESVKALGIKGASITIPHKIEVMKYIDEADDAALKIGAVNTLINNNGIIKGYNSDGLGAVKALSEKTGIRNKKVAILGAGGAARAVGFSIKNEGGMLTVINRSREKGELLAGELSAEYRPLNDTGKIEYDILINTTSVGMKPEIGLSPVAKSILEKGMVVMDIVYNPLKTRLLKDAEEAGCTTINGISMFVHQGAFQFELWTGNKAPFDIMKKAVMNALAPLKQNSEPKPG